MTHLIRKEVQKLKGYSIPMPTVPIKLNQNESPYDLPPVLKKKVMERLESLSWNRYPTPFADPLREKIANREDWMPEGVVVSGGSNILIQAIVMAASIKGKILTVTPSFSLYEIEGALLENRIVEVDLNKGDFSLPREKFLKAIKQVKPNIIFLANPNAPTGNLFREEDLLAILRMAPGLVVVDEAYYPFSGETLRPYLKRFRNLILIRTLSKAFSLAGVRLGYLLAHPKIAAEIRKVILPFSVGLLTEAVGEVVLDESGYVDDLVKEIVREREGLYEKMRKIPNLSVYPSSTNFLLFQSRHSKLIFKQLFEKGILIRDVSSKKLPNALRVTVGSLMENKVFLAELAGLEEVAR